MGFTYEDTDDLGMKHVDVLGLGVLEFEGGCDLYVRVTRHQMTSASAPIMRFKIISVYVPILSIDS